MAKGKVAGAIIGGLVGIGLIAGIVFAVSNKGGGPNVPPPPPQTQLAMVQNIEYDYKDGLLTWDEVEHADSYHVKVDNGEEQKVNSTYYTFNLENDVTYFQIQACDTTGNYKASEWTEPYAVTKIKEDDSLVDAVNNFVNSIALKSYKLEKVISIMPEDNYLVTNAVYDHNGEKYLLTDYTDCGKPVESLKEALKTENAYDMTNTRAKEIAKDYDTEASFMARENGYSESIQRLVDENKDVKFVTSQAYEASKRGVGLRGIVKATDGVEEKFYFTNIEIYTGTIYNEEVKYTTAVEQADAESLYENYFTEITGDFAEYAKQLDELQNQAQSTTDYGMSF